MTPEAAIYLGIITAIGLVLKLAILFNVEIKNPISQPFVMMCLFFIMQAVAEFLGYIIYPKSTMLSEFFFHGYVLTFYFVCPSALLLILSLTDFNKLTLARNIFYSIAVLFSLAYINGWVVSDINFVGWSEVALIPGPLFLLSVSYILLYAIVAVIYLFIQALFNADPEAQFNCKVTIVGISPMLVVAYTSYILRAFGYGSTSPISAPIVILLFMYVMLQHTNGNIFWLSTKLKVFFAILTMKNTTSVDNLLREIEKTRIQEALKLTKGKQTTAAEILELTAPTLNKRISKHNIDIKSYK